MIFAYGRSGNHAKISEITVLLQQAQRHIVIDIANISEVAKNYL